MSIICNDQIYEQIKNKEIITKYLDSNNIDYTLVDCCGNTRICINICNQSTDFQRYCCNSQIRIISTNNCVYKIYLKEILFITVEKRKTILFLTNRKIETNYQLRYWKETLDLKIFSQPHSSYLVNLNYVSEVTKDAVVIKYEEKTFSIYASKRKISAFKKAFLNYNKINL